jgi:serine/threonine protein kinase
MAACTKPPKMCIVMEHMSLGSLYEVPHTAQAPHTHSCVLRHFVVSHQRDGQLLHNELIPEIPLELKVKMAYQAAKGMHFLHSSGIVHRDLKSLNLLLDAKWNVKVSDFGLTKFREEVQKATVREAQGSIHWTAPEVLNETADVDLTLADVYSFGIIMWELMTREQPYAGMGCVSLSLSLSLHLSPRA